MANSIPLGIRLNNPGNIELGPKWQGLAKVQQHKRFATFETPHFGLRALARVIMTYATQRRARDGSPIDTLRDVAERWAPANENNTTQYAKTLSVVVGVPPTEEIDLTDLNTMVRVMRGIVRAENSKGQGKDWFSEDELRKAARAAGVRPAPAPAKSMATSVSSLTAAGGIEQIQQGIYQAQDAVTPLAWYLEWAQYGLIGLAMLSACITIYIMFFRKRAPA